MTFPPSPTFPSPLHKISTIFSTHHTIYKYPQRYPLPFPQDTALPHFPPLSLSLSVLPSLDRPQEKLLGQSQWKDYSAGGHPPHHPPYHYNDSFETDGDMKAGWQQQRGSYERHGGGGGGGGGGGTAFKSKLEIKSSHSSHQRLLGSNSVSPQLFLRLRFCNRTTAANKFSCSSMHRAWSRV